MNLELDLADTLFLVIDVQERLAPAMHPELYGTMVQNLKRLAEASRILDVPVVMSEQYPKGLGPTVPPIREAFANVAPLDKTCFSVAADDRLYTSIQATGRRRVVVAGMEAHICVYQTARGLVGAGYGVHVLADGVASRTPENYRIGLDLIAKAGGVVTSTEVVLFDLLGAAGTDAFRAISKLVR